MNVSWIDCEQTIENFLKNVKSIDKLNNLSLMIPILGSYYSIREGSNPKELELFLRENNLNVGLIAVKSATDSHYSKIISENKGVIVKKKYMISKDRSANSDIPIEHHANHHIIISCRPRDAVIEETLTYSSTMDENLAKLEEAGNLVIFNENDNSVLASGDTRLSKDDQLFAKLISEGKKLINITKIDLEVEFKKVMKENSGTDLKVYGMLPDGSPLFIITKNNKILSPIALNIYHDSNGNKMNRFISLSNM